MARKTVKPQVTESWCLKERRIYDLSDFNKSPNPNHDAGVLPYCKSCTQEIFKKYLKKYGTLQAATYFTCAEMGIPFIRKIYESFEAEVTQYKNVTNYFGNYILTMYRQQTKAEKELWTDFGASDVDLKDIKALRKTDKALEMEKQELEIVWGKQYDSEELAYLEYRFSAYTEGKILEEYEEMTYRNLCKAELDIYLDQDTESALKRQAQCAKILKLDNFKAEEKQTQVERMLEAEIAVVEQEEPAEYYTNKGLYRDFRRIGLSWILEIMRPLRNLVINSKEYNVDVDDLSPFDEKVEEAIQRNAEDGTDRE